MASVVLALLASYGVRAVRFARNPTLPVQVVLEQVRERLMPWAAAVGVAEPLLATPDVGGALWDGRARVLDLAGLIDRGVASRLGDRAAMADHLLARRPDFVFMAENHAWLSGLTHDPRFHRQYVGIETWTDPWILRTHGVEATVGRFVRRDLLTGGVDVAALRRIAAVDAR